MKRTIARFVLLASLVLSAYSVVGAVTSGGQFDGPNPPPQCPADGCGGGNPGAVLK